MASIKGYATKALKAGQSLRSDNLIEYLEADDTIAQGIFVELVTSGHVKAADATVGGHIGIALGAGVDGDVIPVLVAGFGTVTCDATGCALNDYLKPDSSGKADVAAIATDTICALALGTGAANGVVPVKLMMISLDTNT